ncbi:hypothetical protein SAMN02745181_3716 [Rubritalea squalenifaciens DSM 18772]|uniref:Uncharacterized protein n=3 Tax=Rubritaleaceae TaxID=1648490 RepID=A0A1M6RYK2_9BACT|nr:hypothetical protein SAMN02745181_3716 [Rubritalea squalenifaciens DSM 18772]
MNTMKILIGATFALLLAGLITSYQTMKNNEKSDPRAAEIEKLEKRLAELEAAKNSNAPLGSNNFSNNQYGSGGFQPQAVPNPLEQQAATQAAQLQIEKLKQEIAELKNDNEDSVKKADLAEREAQALLENEMDRRQPEMARANRIKQALLMARVEKWYEEEKLVTILIERPEDVQSGLILAIRRNSGIIGRLQVGTVENNKAVADPIPGSFLGGVDIREGDELIVPPAY